MRERNMSLSERWQAQLEQLRADHRYRALTTSAGIDFSSNDYLGYSKRPWPHRDLPRSGTASRLLRGHHPLWDDVEAQLAEWHGAEAALVMTSGYAANEGLLGTIIEPGDTVFSDQDNHASIIDGFRLSKAEKVIFPHNDVNALDALLRRGGANRRPHAAWFIVTESLFGMSGERAPLAELADLAERHDAHLIVDEAHATGCFGPAGSGLVDALGLRRRVLATVHTGGKALAVPGAYIAGSRLLKDLLVNRCRHLIYTTALPPQVAGWWLDTLASVRSGEVARQALRERVRLFRETATIQMTGADQIAALIVGADGAAVEAAKRLRQAGFDIRAIRPPTVPAGTARLRISLHADHDPAVLRDLADALKSLMPTLS
jgi:8-amino-7-oxononanoate synthase